MEIDLHPLDYAVIIGYLGISLGFGILLCRRSNREEFFAAGRSMGRITVGLSVMATLFSANSFVMYPSTAYGNSLRLIMALVAFWTMAPVVAWVFIPVYAKLNCSTAYEYLEKRFHVSVRCLASSLFILLRISWMAAATSAAAVAISGISGLNEYAIIIGLGVVAIAYTMLGGLRAVMWTDVLQFFVFFGTILFALVLLISQVDGGLSGIIDTYFQEDPGGEDRSKLVLNFSLDPTLRFGTIAILIGSFLEGLSAFGADQVAVQRYIAAKDVKTSQVGFFINMTGTLIVIPGLLAIGAGLFSYFHHHPEDLSPVAVEMVTESGGEDSPLEAISRKEGAEWRDVQKKQLESRYEEFPGQVRKDILANELQDQAMPQFVRLKFPPGVVGLLIAALMAATMSSIDSGIHSVTTALVVDFRDRLFPQWRPKTDEAEMLSARTLVVLIGAIAITLACFVGELGDVFAVAKKTVGAFAAPLLAVFILGLFVPRATPAGVFYGTWIGAVATLGVMRWQPEWFSMWFFPIGFFLAVGLSLMISVVSGITVPPSDSTVRSDQILTWWNVTRGTAAADSDADCES